MSELRWNPLIGEWTATATHRQDRTFLPSTADCPLCPTRDPRAATEIPEPSFDIVVFDNKFPTFRHPPDAPSVAGDDLYAVRPDDGVCQVIVYTPDHTGSLAKAPVERLYKLALVWRERFETLGALPYVDYVYIFENRGQAVGVTLHHPHGQIYGYPFVPPVARKELEQFAAFRRSRGGCLLCEVVRRERSDGRRVLGENESFIAYVPFFARWPYEVHIAARRHVGCLTDLDDDALFDLAGALRATIAGYDALFDMDFPYIMALHQRPTDGGDHEGYHFHIEFYPPMRTASKLKYLAGSEAGAGLFINDTIPEDSALELRRHWAQG